AANALAGRAGFSKKNMERGPFSHRFRSHAGDCMQSGERQEPIPPAPERGLPPVEPPSGRFIAQLFLVPGLIVLGVLLALIAVFYLTKAGHTPAYFLRQLDSDNADIRWRAASDLAQILKRPDKDSLRWKTDAAFALDLA